jgi:PDZ domain-containing secreted protein
MSPFRPLTRPPVPPLRAPAVRGRWALAAVLLSLVALLAGALFLIPTPYQVLLPGPVTDVQSLIQPSPKPAKGGKGALYLTTIYSNPASVGEWLYARLNPEAGLARGTWASESTSACSPR